MHDSGDIGVGPKRLQLYLQQFMFGTQVVNLQDKQIQKGQHRGRVAQAKIRNQDDMHTRNNKVGTLRY